jgi:3-oxoacyl-[acyl-carrier protein] reductase
MSDLPVIGTTATLTLDVTEQLIADFAAFSGDSNPLHLDDAFARQHGFTRRVAHGMSYASFLSTMIGMKLPGPGALWYSQTVRFVAPSYPGDRLTLTARVAAAEHKSRRLRLAITADNQNSQRIMEAECEIVLPHRKGSEPAPTGQIKSNVATVGDKPSRVALLAGASGDLGRAIAPVLARQGYAIGLAGRDPHRLNDLAIELGANGARCIVLEMDLRSDASVLSAVTRLETACASVDLAVHAASASLESQALRDVTPADLAHQADIQSGGLLRLFRACSDGMIQKRNGQFIFVGSTVTRGAPMKGLGSYAAAKAAGASLVKSIAAEYGLAGIRANIVSPYFLETRLNAHVSEKARHLAAAQVPLRRLAQLREVAEAVGYLASDASSYITGHDLIVDGGQTMA